MNGKSQIIEIELYIIVNQQIIGIVMLGQLSQVDIIVILKSFQTMERETGQSQMGDKGDHRLETVLCVVRSQIAQW